MMEKAELFGHGTKGNYFTWSNKQTNEMIYSRIDRALCNKAWFMNFPYCEMDILIPHISDHSPIKVSMTENTIKYTNHFNFFKLCRGEAYVHPLV